MICIHATNEGLRPGCVAIRQAHEFSDDWAAPLGVPANRVSVVSLGVKGSFHVFIPGRGKLPKIGSVHNLRKLAKVAKP